MTATVPTSPGLPRSARRCRTGRYYAAESRLAVVRNTCIVLLLLNAGCVGPFERRALLSRKDNIDKVQGPTERSLRSRLIKQAAEDNSPLLKPVPGTDEYMAATSKIEAGNPEEGIKELRQIKRSFKLRKSAIQEDVLFSLGEAYYEQEAYARAEDCYAQLIRDFPSTRHLPETTNRLFKIAGIWLKDPQVADLDEIKQVNYERPRTKLPAPHPPARRGFRMINFTDKKEPVLDPSGNAIAALKLIWLNDPTGPLADDALMLAASHYARTGDFIEADHHFTLLREQYPNSPHVQSAFVLGSHVKLMSYQGADYDDKTLSDARQLKESIRRLYPQSEDRERVEQELAKIALAGAERDWALVELYDKKGNFRAAAVYCHIVMTRHKETPFAEMARQRLEQYGPAYSSGRVLNKSTPDTKKTLVDAVLGRDRDQPPVLVPSIEQRHQFTTQSRNDTGIVPVEPAAPPARKGNRAPTYDEGQPPEASEGPVASKRGWSPLRWSKPNPLPAGAMDDAKPTQTAERVPDGDRDTTDEPTGSVELK